LKLSQNTVQNTCQITVLTAIDKLKIQKKIFKEFSAFIKPIRVTPKKTKKTKNRLLQKTDFE
jgi:hypothetical protein